MTNERFQRLLLMITGIGLIPIALGYGFMPEKTLTPLYGFPVDNLNLRHIMRAIMGLYFAQVFIWFLGVANPLFRRPAMFCLVVFTLGIAAGRIISLVVDGISHRFLIVFLILELIIGITGLILIVKENNTSGSLKPNP